MPGRRGHPGRRHHHPLRRGRLPSAGPPHRRPGRARPRPRPVRPRPRRADPQDARERAAHRQRHGRHPREGASAVRAPGDRVPHQGRVRRRGRGRHHRRRAEPARPGARPAAAHPLRRSAPPYRAGPDPVLRRGHPAAGRADQPPRRRLDRVAAGLPEDLPRRLHRDLPRRRSGRDGRQQGVLPGRQPLRDRHLQHGLEALPAAARGRREAPQAGAGQRREEGRRAQRPGRQDARQGHQDGRRAEHGPPRREAALRARRGPDVRQGRQAPLPGARALRPDPADRRGPVEVVRLAGDLHRRRPGHRQGLPGRHPRSQRRRQDHPAAAARGRGAAGHRPGRPRPRPQARLLRPGARDPGPGAHGPGEHALGRPGHGSGRGPQGARFVPVLRRRRGQARRCPVRRREDASGARDPGGLLRQRAAAGRADQQPRPGQPRGDPRRAAHLQGRGRPGHPRRGRRRGAPAGADHPAARRHRGPVGRRLRGPRRPGVTESLIHWVWIIRPSRDPSSV
ncbi:conserved hypothetical protein [Streptomyces misionensis JCM 4497]